MCCYRRSVGVFCAFQIVGLDPAAYLLTPVTGTLGFSRTFCLRNAAWPDSSSERSRAWKRSVTKLSEVLVL
jgi:hypothetical protein